MQRSNRMRRRYQTMAITGVRVMIEHNIKNYIKERIQKLKEQNEVYVNNPYKVDLNNAKINELNLLKRELKNLTR